MCFMWGGPDLEQENSTISLFKELDTDGQQEAARSPDRQVGRESVNSNSDF